MALKKYAVLIAPAAIIDIQAGIDYYKEIDKALGLRFYEAIKSTFRELKINPNYQIRYKNVRVRTVRKFPYIIHFVVEENEVIIYGVRFNKLENPEI